MDDFKSTGTSFEAPMLPAIWPNKTVTITLCFAYAGESSHEYMYIHYDQKYYTFFNKFPFIIQHSFYFTTSNILYTNLKNNKKQTIWINNFKYYNTHILNHIIYIYHYIYYLPVQQIPSYDHNVDEDLI